MKPAINIASVSKHFGDVVALDDVSLAINDREFFTLLGPSGCGKTTLLRILAGFESINSGSVALYGDEIGGLPPHKRPVNTVFQQYSLFPHMTVEENVRFGLEMKGVARDAIKKRTSEMLELVQLGDFSQRKSVQLSGGQQQCVALARALAPEPRVLLLDEPLSALDLKLRQAMRSELKQIQQETGITFVFVTHDQEEALTMSDRIAVMSQGRLQQIGQPEEIYREPANRFVADFIGETNLLDATLEQRAAGGYAARLVDGSLLTCEATDATSGQSGVVSIRPESIRVHELARHAQDNQDGSSELQGTIKRKVFLGTDTQWIIQLDSGVELVARQQNDQIAGRSLGQGDRVFASADAAATKFLSA